MTDRISLLTKALLTLSVFFVCATVGAALALFTGWPVAILSGIVGFICRPAGRWPALPAAATSAPWPRKWRICARAIWNSRPRCTKPAARLGEMGGADRRARQHPGKEDRLRTEGAGNPDARFRRQDFHAAPPPLPAPTQKPQRGPATAYLNTWATRTNCWRPSAPAWKKTASISICSPSSACRSASCAITRRCRACAPRTARSSCRPSISRWPAPAGLMTRGGQSAAVPLRADRARA